MNPLTLALNWAAAYLVHSTLLLLLAWAASRVLRDRRIALQETLWRGALFGALLTATLQVGLPALDLFEPASQARAERVLPVEESAALSATPLAETGPAGTTLAGPAALSPFVLPAWAAWAFLATWAIGALFGLARLGLASRRLSRRLRHAHSVAEGPVHDHFVRVSEAMGLPRSATLIVSEFVDAPFAAGIRRPRVVLPSGALERLGRVEQQGLVAHEAAHVARRDPAWLLAALVVERVLFFQPLNRIARTRLQETAELLADERASLFTGGADELARCLVEVAGWRSAAVESAPVVGAVSGSGALARRVERLLSGRRDAGRGLAWPLTLALIIAVAFVPGTTWSLSETPAPEAPAVVEVAVEAAPEPPRVYVRSGDAAKREQLEELAQQYKRRVEEMRAQERAVRRHIEELAARAEEAGDEQAEARLAQLKAELEVLRAKRLEERARFEKSAEELGATNFVVRGHVAGSGRAPRAARSLEAEQERLEAELAALSEREERLKRRLEALKAREEAQKKEREDK